MDYLSTILKPIVTEKSTSHGTQNKYVFEVLKKADKTTIKKAFEEIYGAKAQDVRTYLTPSKSRTLRRGKTWTKRPVTKRAIITVEKGKTIDVNKIK